MSEKISLDSSEGTTQTPYERANLPMCFNPRTYIRYDSPLP